MTNYKDIFPISDPFISRINREQRKKDKKKKEKMEWNKLIG